MFLDDVPVNYLAVLAAAFLYIVIGALWYAPFLFGSRLCSVEHERSKECKSCCISSYIGEFIAALIMAYVLALFIEVSQADVIVEAIAVAFWVWIGFIATTHFSAILWGRKSIKNYFIHVIFMLIGLIAMAITIMYLSF